MSSPKQKAQRPWGHYEVLSEAQGYKVKRVTVDPGKRLSLQFHRQRSEHWVIVSGGALVTCGEEKRYLNPGDSIDIPRETLHRIKNPGASPLLFIEVQRGDYLEEDDIIRLEDDYARVLNKD